MNQSLHGPTENVFTSNNKILGIKMKLNPWKNHVVKADFEMVPQFLRVKSEGVHQQVSSLIETTLKNCRTTLNNTFFPFQHKCMTG
jgi:hypothetical protein